MKQIHFEYWDMLGKRAGSGDGGSRAIFRLPSERFIDLGIQISDYFVLSDTKYEVAGASLIDPTMAELFCVMTDRRTS